ncbi:hypothetical protein [Proteiniphilum sp. X52]|uniref:hypothetical protein n=1 Tax=Proteiniphilum sp. X52 TaxID=2382159 RepID=UPI000F0A8B6F|nr:hypothetical protein [Proteiniphilum sp. X52]RNC63303.1 hypothetical protein D7D25_17200 [Proteiniphilum sp. X52]
MKKFGFILLVLLSLNAELVSQSNYQKFHRKIFSTYKKTISRERELDLLNKAIENNKKNRALLGKQYSSELCTLPECDEGYEFITFHRVNFKKMCSAKKKKLKRERFFNYLSTDKLYHSETYVFCKEGIYLGSVRTNVTGEPCFVYGDNIKILAESFYKQVYQDTKPVLYFLTSMPVIQRFIVIGDSIKPVDYDENLQWKIYNMHEFIGNKERFKYKNDFMSNGYEFVE